MFLQPMLVSDPASGDNWPMFKPDAPFPIDSPGDASRLRGCDCPGCRLAGEYRAPRARNQLREYYWFCLDHVREYNRAWDFYAGMSIAEIESEMRLDSTWQRPTWPLGSWGITEQRLRDGIHAAGGFPFGRAHGEAPKNGHASGASRAAATPEDEARQVLELERGASFKDIKARYRELVKTHHPDANGGDKAAEERLKRINQAYTTLKASYGLHGSRVSASRNTQ